MERGLNSCFDSVFQSTLESYFHLFDRNDYLTIRDIGHKQLIYLVNCC